MSDLSIFDLTGKNALVTGGSLGIGRGCATALAMAGANVAIIARSEQAGVKTADALKDFGVDAFFVHCDVSDEAQVKEMMSTVIDRFGRLDIAVNNAGISLNVTEDQTHLPIDAWNKMIAVNLTGTWLCAQAEAQQMIRQSPTAGKIINIGSIAATNATTPVGAYDASKAGVVQLTRNLAVHWGRYNINVNCASPGLMLTKLTSGLTVDHRRTLREATPLRYLGRQEDWYGPICFLASKASNYITGQELVIDGGYGIFSHGGNTSRFTSLPPYHIEAVPPLVSPQEEIKEVIKDLDAMGILYDEDGVILTSP